MVDETPTAALIGPLTAEEWCAFRMTEDDLLQCCAITSEFRDALFYLLRMGADKDSAIYICDEWDAMERHGFPEGVPQIEKLRQFYFGEAS